MIKKIYKRLKWKLVEAILLSFKFDGFSASIRSYSENSKFSNQNIIGSKTNIINSTLGSYTYISSNTDISNAALGNFCSIGQNVKIGGFGKHPLNISTHPAFYSQHMTKCFHEIKNFQHFKNTKIGHDVWIGDRAIILDGINVGTGSVIAAGSVVTKNTEPYSIVGGVPAKEIKKRFSEKDIENLLKIKWWTFSEKDLMEIGHLIADDNVSKLIQWVEKK